MSQKIEISHRTIIFAASFLLGLWFVWAIKSIILQLFVAIIIMTAFNPLVNSLEKIKLNGRKLPRAMAILLVYICLIAVISQFVAIISQPLIMQTNSLVRGLPDWLVVLEDWGINQSTLNAQFGQLYTLPGNLVAVVGGIFSNVLSIFTTLVMAFYMLLERDRLHKHLTVWFGNDTLERQIENLIDHLEFKLGGWVRAEIILMIIVGSLSYVGLLLLGVPYALPLAILAGLLEVVPNIGPFISAIPAVLIGLTVSPLIGLGVVALYLFVQLMENNLIVPQVMSKTVGVNPLVTVVVLLIGFELAGILGAVLAVPTVLLIQELVKTFMDGRFTKHVV